MAKGKGKPTGWITRNGVHIPIYGEYTAERNEPKVKGIAKSFESSIPKKFKFDKWVGGWMVIDGTKERFEEGWDSGIEIKKVPRVNTTYASGRGHSSTEYQVTFKGRPVMDTTFETLSEAKDFIKQKAKGK